MHAFLTTSSQALLGICQSKAAPHDTLVGDLFRNFSLFFFTCCFAFTPFSSFSQPTDSARIYYKLGKKTYSQSLEQAHFYFDRSIRLAGSDEVLAGRAWQYKAFLYNRYQGDFVRAEGAYRAALQAYESEDSLFSLKGSCAKDLGNVYSRSGDYDKAIAYQQQAVAFYQQTQRPAKLAQALSDLAEAWFYKGELAKAREQAEAALQVKGITPLEQGLAKSLLANLFFVQGAFPEGAGTAREALGHFAEVSYTPGLAAGLLSLGDAFLERGHTDSARAAYLQAARYTREFFGEGPRREVGKSYLSRGKLQLRLGAWEEALQAFQGALYQVLPAVVDSSDVTRYFPSTHIYQENVLIEALEGKARAWIGKYQQQPDSVYLQHALAALDLLFATEDHARRNYDFESSRLKVGELRHPRVELALWVISRLEPNSQRIRQAFGYVESSKALGLMEELRNDRSRSRVLPEGVRKLWQEKEKSIWQVEKQLGDRQEQEKMEATLVQLQQMRFQLSQFVDSLERIYPDYYRFKYDYRPRQPEELLASLPEGSELVEYFRGDSALYAFHLSAQGLKMHDLGPPREHALRKLLTCFQGNASEEISPEAYAQAAYALYQQLLQPLELQANRLTIVPDRDLARLPFDALLSEAAAAEASWPDLPYLLFDKTLSYAWSANLLHFLNQQSARPGRKMLSVSPIQYADLPDLTAGRALNDRLQTLWPGGRLLSDTAATQKAFLQALQGSDYSLLNLYTHAQADPLEPARSWIRFREPEPEGLLYLSELRYLKLDAELAVLGACNTGIGREVKGEGLMSFARGFTYAGCRSIISTLWESDEQSTAQLLAMLFEQLAEGEAKDQALAQAKRAFLSDRSARQAYEYHPRYWGSLMAIGDMAPLSPAVPWGRWLVALALLLVLSGAWWLWRRR